MKRELKKLMTDQDKTDKRRRAKTWKYRKLPSAPPAFGRPDPKPKRKLEGAASPDAGTREAKTGKEIAAELAGEMVLPVDEAKMALERDISTAALRVADRAPHEVALQRDGAVTRAKLTEQARVVFDLLRSR